MAEFEIECGLTRKFPEQGPSVGSDLYVNGQEAHVIWHFPRLAENEPARCAAQEGDAEIGPPTSAPPRAVPSP
jgi:hypothetical protein